jgi:hypothetical protein
MRFLRRIKGTTGRDIFTGAPFPFLISNDQFSVFLLSFPSFVLPLLPFLLFSVFLLPPLTSFHLYSLSRNCLPIENRHVPTAKHFKMTKIHFPVAPVAYKVLNFTNPRNTSSSITKKSNTLLDSKNNY